jgi:arylsulfatase A-like enzyme
MNIICIVTDSARNFSTGGLDDRDRPVYYDSLENEFCSFNHAVTSAPSSVMSGSTMLTGLSSYFIGRNYDDFRFEKGVFTTLPDILQEQGYETKGIFVAREMRDKIAPFIGHVEKKYWPKNLKHADKMWGNDEANQVLEGYLQHRNNKDEDPLFLMVWNNIRHDDHISENLQDLEEILKKYDYWDNSIIIFTADHGYPHPRRGFTPEGLKRDGLTHDLILSDDNILIPLLIKAPGIKASSIDEIVGTVDFFPTIMDYLGINPDIKNCNKLPGLSLKPLLEGSTEKDPYVNRYMRCDSRFIGQSDRGTAIRSRNFKYVYFHDSKVEEFYDLNNDPGEDENLYCEDFSNKVFKVHKQWFEYEESTALKFQQDYATSKLEKKLFNEFNNKKIILFSTYERSMNNTIVELLSNNLSANIIFCCGSFSTEIHKFSVNNFSYIKEKDTLQIKKYIKQGAKVMFLRSGTNIDEERELLTFLKDNKLSVDTVLDMNFSTKSEVKWNIKRVWRALLSRKSQIISEPAVLLTYGKQLINLLMKSRR